ncbi:hypothetical protein H7I41_16895 [Mycobacterium manitobense]|uniref:Uncharacterized protein n=1 Tax=[Mycobacterium] manitobense TaxID=190147 RepID=A0A9X2YPM9_9MYCO|nr:hypothetical protein [[Mycobacterium] manitobense]MCV7171594.1 hypothetical protein [[Mycobacterium] manitobense]
MAMSSLRPLMCAGVVVGGLVVAGPAAGVAIADPGLSDDAGNRDSSDSGKRDADRKPGLRLGSRNDDGSGSQRKRRPFGISLGRDGGTGSRDDSSEREDERDKRLDITVPGGRRHPLIPQVRVSVGGDTEREPDACSGSNCVALRVAGPGVSASVSMFSEPEPEPEPPGPAFRGGPEDVDPVVDAGGADDPGLFIAGSPGVLEVPMIVAPPPVPVSVVGMSPLPAVVPGAPAGTAPSPELFGIQAALPSSASGGPMIVSPGFNAPALPGSSLASGAATRSGLPSARHPGGPGVRWLGAMPGLFGLFLVTVCGGFIGYRQANAVRYVRAGAAERFLG